MLGRGNLAGGGREHFTYNCIKREGEREHIWQVFQITGVTLIDSCTEGKRALIQIRSRGAYCLNYAGDG